MKSKNFQDLFVWQKSHRLVLMIYQVTKSFPETERFGLVNQVRRSSSSICANICEGFTKSRRDFIRYLDISRGSLEGTKYHLILSRDLGYLAAGKFKELFALADEIGKMIFSYKQRII